MSPPEIDLRSRPMAPEWEATEGPAGSDVCDRCETDAEDDHVGIREWSDRLGKHRAVLCDSCAEVVVAGRDERTPANAAIEDAWDAMTRQALEKWARREGEGRP